MTYTNSAFRPPPRSRHGDTRAPSPAPPVAQQAARRTRPLISVFGWICAAATLIPVMLWSSVSIAEFTHDQGAPWGIAWVPAVATDGAMLVATQWAVNYLLDASIRKWAAGVAVTGIVGSVLLASLQHMHLAPHPLLAGLVGGVPSVMAAAIVHVIAMIYRQQQREKDEQAAAESASAERAAAERVAEQQRQNAITVSENELQAAKTYARVRPLEIERENQQRSAEQCDKDRNAAEREQIRRHGITLTGYFLLARRLQAAALATKHAGMATQQHHSTAPRNGAPGARTRSAPAPHQVPAPGVAPGLHQDPTPAAPGAAPGVHQVRPPAPHQPPTSGGNGQVRPDVAWLADLAEPWREANPGAGRIKLVQELVRLVHEAGAEAGAHLVCRPGETPGARITDDMGKKVHAELKRRNDQREIEHLESLLSE